MLESVCKACAGTSFPRRVLDSLLADVKHNGVLLIDGHGYDCFPALAAIESRACGKSWNCATIVQGPEELAELCSKRISTSIYELARTGQLSLPAWPAFDTLVSQLRETSEEHHASPDAYKVTASLPCGSLVICDALVAKFRENPKLQHEVEALIEQHNAKYNKEGKEVTVQNDDGPGPAEQGTHVNQVVLQDETVTMEYLESLPKPMCLQVTNAFRLVYDETTASLFAAADDAVTLLYRELFSFGSGIFSENQIAREAMAP